MKIGFIGLGNMGLPMALIWLKPGIRLPALIPQILTMPELY